MAGSVKAKFEFFGAHKGKTMSIGNHTFVDGKYTITESPEGIAGVTKYLSSFSAFAVGSDEYDAAQAAESGDSNGVSSDNEATPEPGAPETVSSDDSPGAGNEAAPAELGGEPVGDDSGNSGVSPEGNGQPDAGDDSEQDPVDGTPSSEVDEVMVKAVQSLDPDVDDHWTEDGLPAMSAIEQSFGAGFTRDDIENAVPGWDRARAKELKDL
jgi:hypothetical protein